MSWYIQVLKTKMVQMNLFSKQKQNHRSRKQTYGFPSGGKGGGMSWKTEIDSVSPWTIACQAPLSMGFSKQEYWSGLPCPPLGHPLYPGIKTRSPTLQADFFFLPLSHQGSPIYTTLYIN